MKFNQRVTWAAIALVVISAINIAILTAAAGPQKLVMRAVRFGFTCLLAYHLAQGKKWARWVTAALSGIGAITSFVGFFSLLEYAQRLPVWFLYWSPIMGAAYAATSIFLIASKRVAAECDSPK